MTTTETPKRTKTPLLLAIGAAVVAATVVVVALSGGSTGADGTPGSSGETDQAAAAGPPAPATAFQFFDGTTGTFASYEGRPLVVNFWASWCPSCVAEMSAAFVPAQERFGDTIAFLGLNIQDERSKALQLVEETGVLFDLAEDPQGLLYTELGGLGMPFTVLISPDGEILEKHNGPLTQAQLETMITEAFGV